MYTPCGSCVYVTEFADEYFSGKHLSILTYTVRVWLILATIMLGSYLTENESLWYVHTERRDEATSLFHMGKKVKQSRYRPGVAAFTPWKYT